MRMRLSVDAAADLLDKNVTFVTRESAEYGRLKTLISETTSDPELGSYTGLRTVPYLPLLPSRFDTSHTIYHNRLIS